MTPSLPLFDEYAREYDDWFDRHRTIYEAQVRLLRGSLPKTGLVLDLGTGSGRFAVPLGILHGIDPARNLLKIAKRRGIEAVQGNGEHLPYRTGIFDGVLMMTVICFLEQPPVVLQEIHRVLAEGGVLVMGFLEQGGAVAVQHMQEETKGRFLRFARFLPAEEVLHLAVSAGFIQVSVIQRTRGFCALRASKP